MRLRKFFSSFRRLRWKLTFSYTLVTVAALVAMEVILISLLWVIISVSSLIPLQATRLIVEYAAPQVRPFLETPQPDLVGLEQWLEKVYAQGVEIGPGRRLVLSSISGGGSSEMVVVDAAGRYLASIPADVGEPGKPFPPGAHAPLQDALAGEMDPTCLYTRTPGNQLVIAAPVMGEDGQILGALYFATETSQFSAADYARSMMGLIGISLVVFTLAAALLGTLFGFLTARGFTRRLRTLADVADAWGRGDFSAIVRDSSSDEIGQLARQLNCMAEQVQNLLHVRERLAMLEERNRLARDLHDSVKQEVFAATMHLGAAEVLWERDTEAARQKVAEALALSQQAQQELTTLVRELRPVALEGKGLATALREHVEDWSRQTGIAARVVVQRERDLPLEVERAFFRVAQEALTNVAKHSGAAHVEVTLACTDTTATLTIADDGRGFDVTAAEGRGMGLCSMRERIEAIGGTLRVASTGAGSTVEANVSIGEM